VNRFWILDCGLRRAQPNRIRIADFKFKQRGLSAEWATRSAPRLWQIKIKNPALKKAGFLNPLF
jgi:hypothetical protein